MAEGETQPKTTPAWIKLAPMFLLTFVAALAISRLDIMGLYDSLVPLSDRIALRVAAPIHSHEGQKHITVVLINEAFMKRVGGGEKGWPLASETMRNLLQQIADAGPKALFLDVVLTDMPRPVRAGRQPDGDKGIVALAGDLGEISRGVPILVTNTLNIQPGREAHCVSDWTDIDALGDNGTLSAPIRAAAIASRAYSDGGKAAGLEVIAANWLDARDQYPIGIAVASHDKACNATVDDMPALLAAPEKYVQGGYLASPATALYALYCRGSREGCPDIRRLDLAGQPGGYRLYAIGPRVQQRMLVRWGSRQSPQMQADFAQAERADDCIAQNTDSVAYEAIVQSVHAILPFLNEMFDNTDRTCPYFDTLTADEVIETERYFPDENPQDFLRRYLKGRIVMVGSDLPYVQDRIASPIAGELPGVYLHAMALDNLIDYGNGYQRQPTGLNWWLEGIVEALSVALLAIGLPLLTARLVRLEWVVMRIERSAMFRLAAFFATLAVLLLLVLVLALCLTALIWPVLGFNPVFVALAITIPLIEELRHEFFPLHAEHAG